MKFLNYFGWIFLGLILVLMVTILGANIYVAVTMEDFKCADITQPKFELDQCNEHLDLLCEFNVPYSEPCYYEEPEEYPECVTFEEELAGSKDRIRPVENYF